MTTTDRLIADLQAGLAAAKALAGDTGTQGTVAIAEPEPNMMPGGVDSAPVSATEALPQGISDVGPEAVDMLPPFERAAETEGLDLLAKLADGKPIKEVAKLLHEVENSTAVESIVKAISDIAQGVRI